MSTITMDILLAHYLRYKKYCDYGVTELMLLPGTINLKVT